MSPEYTLPVTQEEYEKAGSKFVTYPFPLAESLKHVGDFQYRNVEMGMLDWEKQGESMKIPVTVITPREELGDVALQEEDEGKEDKISFGVTAKGIWKAKIIWKAITGKDMPMKKGGDNKMRPSLNPEDINGLKATAVYQIVTGKKGGTGETVAYPKLVDIFAADFKVGESKDIGI